MINTHLMWFRIPQESRFASICRSERSVRVETTNKLNQRPTCDKISFFVRADFVFDSSARTVGRPPPMHGLTHCIPHRLPRMFNYLFAVNSSAGLGAQRLYSSLWLSICQAVHWGAWAPFLPQLGAWGCPCLVLAYCLRPRSTSIYRHVNFA